MKIGFIGLGIMGKPMASNLMRAGHDLIAFDVARDNLDQVVAAGAKRAASSAEAAADCAIVVTMLPNSPHVKTAVCGPVGVLEAAKPGTILVDMSSIAPAASREVAADCAAKGVEMLDAPVSGGEPKAVDGTLAIMVGGDRRIFERVRDNVLLKMGASAVYCGDIGAGNTTKLVNQIIVACNLAACAEGYMFAKKAGVDPKLVFEAIRSGLAGSAIMNAKVPMMLEGEFKPGFRTDLHIKDLANALDTGHETGSPLPLTAAVMEMFQVLKADGLGQEDHAGIANYYAKLSGARIGDK